MIDLIESVMKDYCESCILKANRCERSCLQYRYDRTMITAGVSNWLNSFNTDSATVCFTAIQELKKAVSEDDTR